MNVMSDEMRAIATAVRQVPGWDGRAVTIAPALPVLASPSWRGVDGACWRVSGDGGETLFVKAMDVDAAVHIDVAAAFRAAVQAGALGVGPVVHLADAATGLLVMDDLVGWRTAGLEDMADAAIVDAAMAARATFQSGAAIGRTECPFAAAEALFSRGEKIGAALPQDIAFLMENVALAAEAVLPAAGPAVPIYGDGNVANLMIRGADVRLVDFDRAGDGDPLVDVGLLLTEAFAFDGEARAAFARLTGGFDEGAFHRAMLYGVADDIRWGLVGALVAHETRRVTVEFQKYGAWRFLRGRLAIRDPRFAERLGRAAC